MGLPGPKPTPQPSNVHELFSPSHRPTHEGVKPPVEAPAEPDWEQTFPKAAARLKLAEIDTIRGSRRSRPATAHLDELNRRARFVAHATWNLVVPDLVERHLVAKVDALALKDLCVTVARLDQAERDISTNGAMLPTERGMVKNPALTMAKAYREQFNRLLPEFGLSPSARTRLRANDFGTDDGDGLFD